MALIKDLVAAVTDTSNCLTTNAEDAAYPERWEPNVTFYHGSQIEAVSWALLQLKIDVHQRRWSVALSDPKQRDDVCLSMKFTFAERMNILLKALRISKSTCEALIKGNRVPELVGCLHVVFERRHRNYLLRGRNARRELTTMSGSLLSVQRRSVSPRRLV